MVDAPQVVGGKPATGLELAERGEPVPCGAAQPGRDAVAVGAQVVDEGAVGRCVQVVPEQPGRGRERVDVGSGPVLAVRYLHRAADPVVTAEEFVGPVPGERHRESGLPHGPEQGVGAQRDRVGVGLAEVADRTGEERGELCRVDVDAVVHGARPVGDGARVRVLGVRPAALVAEVEGVQLPVLTVQFLGRERRDQSGVEPTAGDGAHRDIGGGQAGGLVSQGFQYPRTGVR